MVYKCAFCVQYQFHPEDMTLFNNFLRKKTWKKFMVIVGKIWKTDGSVSSQGLSISFGYFTKLPKTPFLSFETRVISRWKSLFAKLPLEFVPIGWFIRPASVFSLSFLQFFLQYGCCCWHRDCWVSVIGYSAYSFAKSTQWRREKMIMMELTEMLEC